LPDRRGLLQVARGQRQKPEGQPLHCRFACLGQATELCKPADATNGEEFNLHNSKSG
jgi:hypothetical protein